MKLSLSVRLWSRPPTAAQIDDGLGAVVAPDGNLGGVVEIDDVVGNGRQRLGDVRVNARGSSPREVGTGQSMIPHNKRCCLITFVVVGSSRGLHPLQPSGQAVPMAIS
jgi:hypothetical protein